MSLNKGMADGEGETLNSLFEELADWEHQLKHLNNKPSDEFGGLEL